MRRGEKARITVSGDKGFGASGFHGIAREWGIALDAPAVVEVELVNWNTIDATGDGGVLVTLPHASALQVQFFLESQFPSIFSMYSHTMSRTFENVSPCRTPRRCRSRGCARSASGACFNAAPAR